MNEAMKRYLMGVILFSSCIVCRSVCMPMYCNFACPYLVAIWLQ